MRYLAIECVLLVSLPLVGCGDAQSGEDGEGWVLVWSDEFDGTALDASRWNIQTGDGTAEGIPGWGNNELQSYRAANISVSDGVLVITAREEDAGDGHAYTSGRINTAGKLDKTYGRFEARIQAPGGQGLWSAFWMLPTDSAYGGWAAGGEIDILEVFSRDPGPFAQGALHYGMASPLNTVDYARYSEVDPSDGFHVYAVEWDEEEIRWFVDGVHFHTVRRNGYWNYYRDAATNAHVSGGVSAPFDRPFHLLLNLAVGGNLPGEPVAGALPGELRVDYVRVYRCGINASTGVGCAGLADRISAAVTPPAPADVYRAVHDLYVDAAGPLRFAGGEDGVTLDLAVDDADGALAVAEVVHADRGTVIDVATSGGGSFSIRPAGEKRLTLFGMGGAPESGDFAGELQFDLYVSADGTDAAGSLKIKLDSGSLDAGAVDLPLATLKHEEWTTVTVQMADIVRNPARPGGRPVDLGRVRSLFALEPASFARLQVDNIRLICGHVVQGGCGIGQDPQR
ncbi:MAG: glycoside hydrolase family 16 protein [Holophagales bacterium]|nr:glycoside hydrolase family 16 protein [Holophagales bacterium]MYG29888.1 glycoside hydrolase family 16 protein [Holophagales bacterium]MYI79302.1 glycoside hydrolase family 16 protein [Holophagales bacterium]